MPTRTIAVTGTYAVPTKLNDRNPSRSVLVFRNIHATASLLVSDCVAEVYSSFKVEPGDTLVLLAADGWDVTVEFYGYFDDLSADQVVVTEQFLSDKIMRFLALKGVDSTAGIVLIAGLLL